MTLNTADINILRQYLVGQALAYLVTGIFFLITNIVPQGHFYRYFGHILLAASFIILASMFRDNWMQKIRLVMDKMLGQAVFIAILGFLFVDLVLYTGITYSVPTNEANLSPLAITWIVLIWIGFYVFFEIWNSMRRLRRRISNAYNWSLIELGTSFVLLAIILFLAGVIAIFTQLHHPTYFWGISYTLLIVTLALDPWHK